MGTNLPKAQKSHLWKISCTTWDVPKGLDTDIKPACGASRAVPGFSRSTLYGPFAYIFQGVIPLFTLENLHGTFKTPNSEKEIIFHPPPSFGVQNVGHSVPLIWLLAARCVCVCVSPLIEDAQR